MYMEEIWKDVRDYEGYYQVSNWGRVRSIDRVVTKSNGVEQSRRGRIKKQWKNKDGYLTVKLSKDHIDYRAPVHELVAQSFIEYHKYGDNDGLEINHKDTNRENNRVDNLEWVTHQENVQYSASLGHYKHFGADNPNYGNHKLKDRFREHPELLASQARKGKQNGRCVPINAEHIKTHKIIRFDYLREAANYFKENNLTTKPNTTIKTIVNTIKRHIKNNKPYFDYKLTYA